MFNDPPCSCALVVIAVEQWHPLWPTMYTCVNGKGRIWEQPHGNDMGIGNTSKNWECECEEWELVACECEGMGTALCE